MASQSKEIKSLSCGDYVRLTGSSLIGRITKIDLKRNRIEVEVDGKRIKVSAELVTQASHMVKVKKNERKVPSARLDKIPVLDLHGHTKEQAKNALLKMLDKAILQNAAAIEIIHGHGEGIIKKLVHDFLSKSNHVATFTYKTNNTGTTIAYLR